MRKPPRTREGRRQDSKRLMELYRRLLKLYGPQHWWPGDDAFEIAIGAILTQSAAWGNVEKAIANLKSAGVFSLEGLRDISEEELARLIRPSGYFNAKAKKLKAFVMHLWQRHQGNLQKLLSQEDTALREELLSIYGIGEETADDIVLYAADKPSFVVDAYTRRILTRVGMAPHEDSYRAYQEVFHHSLPPDVPLYNEYHALLVRHGKESCQKKPRCGQCCLLDLCPTGTEVTKATGK